MRQPRRSRAAWTLLVGLVLGSLVGCGESDGGNADAGAASSTPTAVASAAPPDAAVEQQDVGQYTATDDGGDEVSVQVSLGEPTLASQAESEAVQECASRVSSLGRSVVVPISYDVTLQSGLSGDLHLGYGDTGGVVQNSQFDQLSPEFWAATYSDAGPVCANPQDYNSTVGSVVFNKAQPAARHHFTAYLVADGVITPDASSAEEFAKTILLDRPDIRVGDEQLEVMLASGTNVVTCGAFGTDPAAGAQFRYVAVDPATATAGGCTE